MAELFGLRLAIAGAGVFGLCVALRAVCAGATVEVWDPAPIADNASAVAAGMIAPAGEILLDAAAANAFPMFRAGRDGWLDVSPLAPGLGLEKSGAIFIFPDSQTLVAAQARLGAIGAAASMAKAEALQTLRAPFDHGALFTSEDWLLDPQTALRAMKAAITARGGTFKAEAMTPAVMDLFDTVVLAAGMESRAFRTLALELSSLTPIKGQIVRFDGGPQLASPVRTSDLYIVPQAGGTLVGATMEAGRDDRLIDADMIKDLRRRAVRLAPSLAQQPYHGLAGVRASTPDGLPMAGPSSRPGLLLATGARRNGWLLAPLVSEILLSYLSGGDGGPFAPALDPRRLFRA